MGGYIDSCLSFNRAVFLCTLEDREAVSGLGGRGVKLIQGPSQCDLGVDNGD